MTITCITLKLYTTSSKCSTNTSTTCAS
ncbi:unnamed protein product [Callosobruchus maculatus]|uniref:Uncharacterized protein n=1 Tax=Callosobruchus maculatus TaxID=64391 RepID=A0A653BTK3_CALMS|nr:unnamed protein product [Callosobruchus maculatus]